MQAGEASERKWYLHQEKRSIETRVEMGQVEMEGGGKEHSRYGMGDGKVNKPEMGKGRACKQFGI